MYTAPNPTGNVAMCMVRDAGEDVWSQGVTPAGGRVPHLLRVGGEAPLLPEPKPPRAGSGLPNPRLRVALATPESTFASSSTPPASRSSPLLPGSSPGDSTPPVGRSSSPLSHAGQIGPLWPALEGWRFRISTAPVTLLGPAPCPLPPAPRPEVGMVPAPRPVLNPRTPSRPGPSPLDWDPYSVFPP